MSQEQAEFQQRHVGRRYSDRFPSLPADSNSEFKEDKNKVLMYLLTSLIAIAVALIGYLCLESKKQGEILARMEERSKIYLEQNKKFTEEQLTQDLHINRLSLEMKELQIKAADRGWNK